MTLPDPIGDAVGWVGDGRLLAYPTETVWGLGADASSADAVARLRRWKGRDDGTPISVLVASADAAKRQGCEIGPAAARLAAAFWPGPLTLVVPSSLPLAPGVARDDGAVGLRCSSHPLTALLVRRLDGAGVGPLTATSLNRSGAEPARSREQAKALADGGADGPRLLEVEGAEAGGEAESTVVDLVARSPRVLRWGAVREPELGPVLEELGA